ncbi:tetratricopeptide repeat protein [Arsukibacterium perlucidum]|uniref:tetratricopeptide repeat protein n=1 Tax=Arsukibacterium perlucidum TaxID=368811 RepID=UPI000362A380|nr:tetratricopeptide repeat protein [Arsukibacterium perlucidum]
MISLDLIKRFQQISYCFNQQAFSQVASLCANRLAVKDMPVEISLMYAVSLRRLGDFAKSQAVFVAAVALHKNYVPLRTAFGNLLLEMGDTKQALEQFRQVITLQPRQAEGYFNSARALRQLGEAQRALQMSRQAYQCSKDINNAIALAEDLTLNEQLAEAEQLYSSLLQQHPENIKVLNNLGNLQRRLGRLKEAIGLLSRAATSNNPTVIRNLAACFVLNNQFELATEYYKRAIALAPDIVVAYTEFTAFLWQQGAEQPFDIIEQRLVTAPADHALRIAYVKILLQLNLPDKARQYLLPTLTQFPTDSNVLTLAAMVYRDNGEYPQAVAFARNALQAVSGGSDIPARSELAYTLLAQHQGEQAAAHYRQLIKDDPLNQGWWTTLSSALKQVGDERSYSWLCNYDLVDPAIICHAGPNSLLPANFNQQLLPLLDSLHRNIRPPLGLSLQKGSQTFENLFDSQHVLLQQLRDAILAQASSFIASLKSDDKHPFLSRLSQQLSFQGSWSVKLSNEGFHKSHFHPMGWLSGVYYVDVPPAVEREGQGWLVFGRPDIPSVSYAGDYAVKPKPGMLVLFPSFMWHGTNPFSDKAHRVTVAFDLIPQAVTHLNG